MSSSRRIPLASPARRAPIWAASPPNRCSTRSTAGRWPASSIRKSGRLMPSVSSAHSASRRSGRKSFLAAGVSPRDRNPYQPLSIERRGRKLFHAFRDDVGQLHHLLTELGVFRNLALNAIAVGVQLSSQRLQITDQAVHLA